MGVMAPVKRARSRTVPTPAAASPQPRSWGSAGPELPVLSGRTQETAAVGPLTEVGPTRRNVAASFFSMTPSGRAAGTGN